MDENIFLDHFEGYHIRVKTIARKTSEITDIIIIQTINNDRIITADRGLMYFSSDGSTLMLQLEDGEILEVDAKNHAGITRTEFSKQIISIPGASSDLERSSESTRGDREMTVAMMREQNRGRMEKMQASLAEADSLVNRALSRALSIPETDPESRPRPGRSAVSVLKDNRNVSSRLTFLEKSATNYKREINSMEVEIQKKFSIPAACVSFVLIGAPLGAMARKGGFATGIALSLFFFIVYWAFLIGGEQLADSGSLPAVWAMWLPNIFVGGAGIMLNILYIRQSSVTSFRDRLITIIRPGRSLKQP